MRGARRDVVVVRPAPARRIHVHGDDPARRWLLWLLLLPRLLLPLLPRLLLLLLLLHLHLLLLLRLRVPVRIALLIMLLRKPLKLLLLLLLLLPLLHSCRRLRTAIVAVALW